MDRTAPSRVHLEGLVESVRIGSLLPPVYASYERPLTDGLVCFLAGLRPERLVRIVREQAVMPAGIAPAARLVALMRHCPTLHKLGQVVARHRQLDPGLRAQLQRLECAPAEIRVRDLQPTIERELGPGTHSRLTLGDSALAEGSVAVVVPASWHDPQENRTTDVVLKILKPGIEVALEEELTLLADVAALLDEGTREGLLPPLGYADTFEEVRELLRHEVVLSGEQSNLRWAAEEYSGSAAVDIPRPLDPLCTPRITGMSRIDGVKVTEHPRLPHAARRRLASTIIETLLCRPVFARSSQAVFHADPHAGNLLAGDDGRLGVLDWSLVGRLTKGAREGLAAILLGAFTLDRPRIATAIDSLSLASPRHGTLVQIIDEALHDVRLGHLPGLSWVVSLFDRAVSRARVAFAGDLLLFRKTLLTLEGVLADVSDEDRTDWVLFSAALSELQKEWPARWWTPWTSRAFGSHLSTVDLASLMWSAPPTMARYWWQTWQDCMRVAHGRAL